jgi:hypothetical protein
MIMGRRTKPPRGRNKSWYEAPFFLIDTVRFGVRVLASPSFVSLQGKSPRLKPQRIVFFIRAAALFIMRPSKIESTP